MTSPPEAPRNILWTTAGLLSLGIGILGIFLPLLPTTPLVLLAAFCFAKGSPRLHAWLLNHPRFGQSIRDWQDRGSVPPRAKRLALAAMAATLALSFALGLSWLLIVIQASCLGCVAIFLLTRPNT